MLGWFWEGKSIKSRFGRGVKVLKQPKTKSFQNICVFTCSWSVRSIFDPANKPSRRGSNRPKIEAKLNQKIDPDFNWFLKWFFFIFETEMKPRWDGNWERMEIGSGCNMIWKVPNLQKYEKPKVFHWFWWFGSLIGGIESWNHVIKSCYQIMLHPLCVIDFWSKCV